MLLEKLNLFSIRSSNVTSLIKTNEQCVTVSCRVIVCKIRGAVDNDLEQFVPKIHRYRFELFLRNTPRKCTMMAARAARLFFLFRLILSLCSLPFPHNTCNIASTVALYAISNEMKKQEVGLI